MMGKLWARESVRAALILLFILNVAFLPCIWGNRTLLASARDAASIMPDGAWAGTHETPAFPKTLDEGVPGYMTEPWFKLIGHQYLTEKNAPLWNPYQAFGMPLAANMESQPFYPLTIALSFDLTPRTYNWYILLRLFIAGFCMYLYLRLFVGLLPALAGGITAMLAGYYVLFLTMQQTSVEILLPAALLTGEYLLRKGGFKSTFWFAIVTFLVLVGGMPESSFILLTFLFVYLLFRVTCDPELRPRWWRHAVYFCVGSVAGFLLSALLLLPFIEFLRLSFDLHQPANLGGTLTGLAHDQLDSSIVTYLFPLIKGPPNNTVFAGVRNYVGVIALFLAIVALIGAVSRRRDRDGFLGRLTFFAWAAVLAALLKRYGFPMLNNLGALPMFRLIGFPKYDELVVSICFSILCAIGMERIVRRHVSFAQQGVACAITSLIALVAAMAVRPVIHDEILSGHVRRAIPYWSQGLAGFLLVALALAIHTSRNRGARILTFPASIVSLLTVEMLLGFIAPVYYVFNSLPTVKSDPFMGAPYIDVLKKQTGGIDRVFCRDGVLFPDWGSAFQLPDIRAVGAMYYIKYFAFLHAFLPVNPAATDGELSNRFNGAGDYAFSDPLSQRLLQLSSVKYIGTVRPFTKPNRRVEEIINQNAGHLIPGREANVAMRQFVLDNEGREVVGEQPPYERLPYTLNVGGNGSAVLHFAYGMDPAVFDKTVGDGAGFTLEVKDNSGQITKIFSRYIDPKHNAQDRHWMDDQVDLSAYKGQTVQVLLSTDPGPKGDTSYDWAAWSDFRFDSDSPEVVVQPFQAISSGEVNVYRYDNVLPRAAVFTRAEVVGNKEEALHKLADPSHDLFESLVVDSAGLTGEQSRAISEMNRNEFSHVKAATIKSYASQRVEVEASLDHSGILILNDSDYPGWTVNVDGRPGNWFSANYMFRGVLLPPGKHTVRFDYQPKSFFFGKMISLGTLLLLGLWRLVDRRREISGII